MNKLLILYGKNKTDLDILDFSFISFQQENETKKCLLKKNFSLERYICFQLFWVFVFITHK